MSIPYMDGVFSVRRPGFRWEGAGRFISPKAGERITVMAIDYCMDSKNSLPLESAFKVTMAFFQSGL